jgi:hypothetical protein
VIDGVRVVIIMVILEVAGEDRLDELALAEDPEVATPFVDGGSAGRSPSSRTRAASATGVLAGSTGVSRSTTSTTWAPLAIRRATGAGRARGGAKAAPAGPGEGAPGGPGEGAPGGPGEGALAPTLRPR